MNDNKDASGGGAWEVSPAEYLKGCPARYSGYKLTSRYVSVRDGTRIAVDVHLPKGAPAKAALPTVVLFTPYYRRFHLKQGHRPGVEASPNTCIFRNTFVPHGYAFVVADVRGCGASFGARDGFRSPRERLDYYDVADWVAAQPWCDGNIGSTGISYVGAAADFLASTGHPAVKAVMPTFSVWDTWSNHFYPGGVLFNALGHRYGEMADALDLDQREVLGKFAYFSEPAFAGPAPVDEDKGGLVLRDALAEHEANFDMTDFMQQLRFRDAGLSDNPDYTSALISPYHYADRDIDARTAWYGVSGWMDGGGYTTGEIQHYLWSQNPKSRLLIGPWDHGARTNVSPWRRSQTPEFGVLAETLRFFDEHLKGIDTGLAREKPVHYFTMGEERWKAADTWPIPEAVPTDFFFSTDGLLETEAPEAAAADTYRADYGCRTGSHTRYDRLFASVVEEYYPDWHGRDVRMLTYTTDMLMADLEVTGQAAVHLHLASSEPDCALFVYLEDVDADGICRYVTEGVFRALHRKISAPHPDIPATGPVHSFTRADAEFLVPGEPAEVAFELLPTSYRFRAGHRVRLALACADSDHFSRIPDGRPPVLTVFCNRERASRVVLPVVG